MKKSLIICLTALIVLCIFAGCGGQTYQSVLDEYTVKFQEASSQLVKEFKSEGSEITDTAKLSKLYKQKINLLNDLLAEGTQKMAEIKTSNNDNESTYKDWVQKLTNIYYTEANKITNEYILILNSTLNA